MSVTKTRKRILFYVPGLEVGGTEKVVHDLATHLPPDRFEPFVTWCSVWGPLGESLRQAGIPLRCLPLNKPPRLAEVVAGIREIQPDIFHSFSHHKQGTDVRAATEAGVPVILTARRDMRLWDPLRTRQPWEPSRNENTRRITVCSEAIAAVVRDVEGVDEAKIRLIYNGVDMPEAAPDSLPIREELGIGPRQPLFGYVGNYRPEKGHGTLLRAFGMVLDAEPDARLICCGGGKPEVKQPLDALASNLGLDGRAFLLDLQTDVNRNFRGLDVCVHPSDTEGFSNALLQSMSHGLPIVATRAGGNPEAILDGESGLLVPPGQPESLAQAMLTMLRNRQLSERLGKAALAKMREKFRFHQMLQNYTALYEEESARA